MKTRLFFQHNLLRPLSIRHPVRSIHKCNHAAPFSTTPKRGRAPPIFINGELQMSKRTPQDCTADNSADNIERLLQADGFSKWGFAIYRCTYESDTDWTAFTTRLHAPVTKFLELDNRLDMLNSYAPTVIQDRSFVGATTATLRAHFRDIWTPNAFREENPGLSLNYLNVAEAGRYRFFITVDQEALESVLSARGVNDGSSSNATGFVRFVKAEWDPDADMSYVRHYGEQEDNLVPLEGSTVNDVGWMNVLYDQAQLFGYLTLQCDFDWEDHYDRPPTIWAFE
ncbi:hypothetical protein BDV18DRAFT_8176 [Aspergillus unguis]